MSFGQFFLYVRDPRQIDANAQKHFTRVNGYNTVDRSLSWTDKCIDRYNMAHIDIVESWFNSVQNSTIFTGNSELVLNIYLNNCSKIKRKCSISPMYLLIYSRNQNLKKQILQWNIAALCVVTSCLYDIYFTPCIFFFFSSKT